MKEKIERWFRSEILGVSDVDLNTVVLLTMFIMVEVFSIAHSLKF